MYEKEIEQILSQMTLKEKAEALTPLDNHYCCIPSQNFYGPVPQDVPRGGADRFPEKIQRDADGRPADGAYHPVAYPSNSSVAMSWDKALTRKIGQRMAQEAQANPEQVNILNRPGMNLKRSPLCGRNYDYLSEDPILTGLLAAEYIKGIQEEGIGACPKHFIANNQEYDRMYSDSVISERALHEVYLRPWKIALQQGEPWMIMSSYNKVNGEWVNSNPEIMDLLRREIGYKGVVVSDYLAIHRNKVEAHKNGMDIELADPANHSSEIVEAVKNGTMSEDEVDDLLRRQLRMALYAKTQKKDISLDMEELHKEAQDMAAQCIVLLKNDCVLPLEKITQKRIHIHGALALHPNVEGSGSGFMNGYTIDIPLNEIAALAKKQGIETVFTPGYPFEDEKRPADENAEAEVLIDPEDLHIAFVGAPYGWEMEGYDRPDIRLPQAQAEMLDVISEKTDNLIIVLSGGSVYDLTAWEKQARAVIFAGMSGEGYGRAIANILFGLAEPGGRLAETFPLDFCHTPAYFDFTPDTTEMPHVNYSEGLLVGYRWYDTRHLPVLYPFGHGLSYTKFAYSDFCVSTHQLTAKDEVRINVRVVNIGSRRGTQVIQLYLHEHDCRLRRPEKELRDFVKLDIAPGESKLAEFTLRYEDFAVYSDSLHRWCVQADRYDLLLNISAGENIAKATVEITEGDRMFHYTEMTALVRFVQNPEFHAYLRHTEPPFVQDFFNPSKTQFLPLIYALPFYRMSEPLQGQALISAEDVQNIIRHLNEN
ncbi:MAG: glycoside hydrolase family 3 C-terminal domain-containing protein [Solobacterium sp.]|nr:glycoside hydrolase family 3 C-terminal domain-containing protein [Solobacterium sp.]